MYVRLAAAWTDPAGAAHAAGDVVDIDPVTLAELEEQGVVDSGDGSAQTKESTDPSIQPTWTGPGDKPTWTGPGTEPANWTGPGSEPTSTDSWTGPGSEDDSTGT